MEACTEYGFFALALSGFWPFIGALILASLLVRGIVAVAYLAALAAGVRK